MLIKNYFRIAGRPKVLFCFGIEKIQSLRAKPVGAV